MPSFDTVCEANLVEVKNAVENTAKEIGTRFDFKGTSAAIEFKDKEITLFGDAEFQLQQVDDILRSKLTKRNVDVRFLDIEKPQKIGGDKVKQLVKVRNGIESELAKKIQKIIKESKLKVQAAIQEARRPAGRHGPAAQGSDRHPPVVRQLPRLKVTPPLLLVLPQMPDRSPPSLCSPPRSGRRGGMSAALWLGWMLSAAPLAASAQAVALSGILGTRALLVVDGSQPRGVAPGETHKGVTVVSVGRDDVVVDVAGQRRTVVLGAAPVSIRSASAGQRVVLRSDMRGHFMGSGTINGRVMQYMVDTGATAVAIGLPDAERMGLPFRAGQPVMMNTANGATQGWRLKLDSVRIGDVELRAVDAVVTPQAMPYVLLGNSFLSAFQMTRLNDEMVLERRR